MNSILREKVNQLNADKAAVDEQNAILSDDNRELKAEIANLKKQVEELSHKDGPTDFEIEILKKMAEIGVDNFASDYAYQWFPNTSKARLEYHIQRLEDAGYATCPFGDDEGAHYCPTQQGLELFRRHA